jgi:hypothetical protein
MIRIAKLIKKIRKGKRKPAMVEKSSAFFAQAFQHFLFVRGRIVMFLYFFGILPVPRVLLIDDFPWRMLFSAIGAKKSCQIFDSFFMLLL